MPASSPRMFRHPLVNGELICAVGLLALGVFVLIYGRRYPMIADGVVGPGMMPTLTGILLTVISGYLAFHAARTIHAAGKAEAAQEKPAEAGLSLGDFNEDEGGAAGKPFTVAGILGMLVLCVLLAPVLGLIPMLGILVFVCVAVFEREGLITAVLMSLASMVISWLLFVQLFEVPMPAASLWQAMGW